MLQPDHFPPIPEDTRRSARTLFGKGNIYIRLGDQLKDLTSDLKPLEIEGARAARANALHALMSILQFAEKLTDRQMIESVRNRVDLKYALHLPMNYRSIHPLTLCEFRGRLLAEPDAQQYFISLLDRLSEFELLGKRDGQVVCGLDMLKTICTSVCIEAVTEAMNKALETLAGKNPEWLRQIALPHWYKRYSRNAQINYWPNERGLWIERMVEIAADIKYLLSELESSQLAQLIYLPDIEQLRQEWRAHFFIDINPETRISEINWRDVGCDSCMV